MAARLALAPFLLLAALAPAAVAQTPNTTDRCLACHSTLGHEASRKFADDIHHLRGLTCAACHGGDPTSDDKKNAKSPARGYRGIPRPADIPQLCGRCHSDPALMRAYNPALRTDQLAQYWTSVHGLRLRQGDTRVAVCSSCHGVHGIRPASRPLSRVHPLHIPETCGGCHSDAAHMKPYKIPTDQLASYRASVHFRALQSGDLSAPTCATCHGNHGAAPPGVASVERVCGTCHAFQEQLFDQSPHKTWTDMGLAACLTCHGNHRIEATSDALVGVGEKSFCVTCHLEGDPAWTSAQRTHTALEQLAAGLAAADTVLGQAERAGMEVGEARLTQSKAQETLIKARVEVHAFEAGGVEQTVKGGLTLAGQARQAGESALAELAFRRKGLVLSLVAIALVVISLALLIREIERHPPKPGPLTG